MDASASEEPLRHHLLGHALRRWWYVVVVCTLALGALALLMVVRATPHYASNATVVLQPTIGNALSPDATVNGQQVTVAMETEAGLVDSPEVLADVSHTLGVPASVLRTKVHATVPPNTKFVTITFRSTDAAAAQRGAEAFANAFLEFRAAQTTSQMERQQSKLDEQALQIRGQLHQLRGHGVTVDADRQVLMNRLATVQESIGSLHATDVYPGTVSSNASRPPSPVGLNPAFIVIAGLMLGLAIGVVVAFAREVVRDAMRPGDALAPGGLPVLSELLPGKAPLALLATQSEEAAEEAFRRLRVGIEATSPEARTVALAAAAPSASVALHVVNLATVMSKSGLHVEIADATRTHAVVSLLEAASGRSGMSGWAYAGLAGPISVVSRPEQDGGPNHVDSDFLEEAVTKKRGPAHYLLIATEPLTSADGETVALVSDAVVMVVDQERTRVSHLERLVRRARMLGMPVVGVLSVPRATAKRERAVARLLAGSGKQPSRENLTSGWRLGRADNGR